MDNALKDRLEILKTAEMMDDTSEKTVYRVIDLLREDGVEPTDEKIGMFLTHLIAALHRIRNNKGIEEVDEALLEELSRNIYYPKALEYFEEIKRVSAIELDKGEQSYVGGYLCVLLSQGKEGNK